jgi:hypothetical protein
MTILLLLGLILTVGGATCGAALVAEGRRELARAAFATTAAYEAAIANWFGETEQFPELRRHIPREELVELAGKVETAKKLAPTRPHPAAPNAKLFHQVVGPGVGFVDRLRDKLSGRTTS